MSTLCHIVAVDEHNYIGKDNDLPWHLPLDLKYFKEITKGHPVIMGRKTFESIGRPLPGRLNIILSRSMEPSKDYKVTSSFEEALQIAREAQDQDLSRIFVIGGGQVYKETLPQMDRIYITRVHTKIEGDVKYPDVPKKEFKLKSSKPCIEDKIPFEWEIYERV